MQVDQKIAENRRGEYTFFSNNRCPSVVVVVDVVVVVVRFRDCRKNSIVWLNHTMYYLHHDRLWLVVVVLVVVVVVVVFVFVVVSSFVFVVARRCRIVRLSSLLFSSSSSSSSLSVVVVADIDVDVVAAASCLQSNSRTIINARTIHSMRHACKFHCYRWYPIPSA